MAKYTVAQLAEQVQDLWLEVTMLKALRARDALTGKRFKTEGGAKRALEALHARFAVAREKWPPQRWQVIRHPRGGWTVEFGALGTQEEIPF